MKYQMFYSALDLFRSPLESAELARRADTLGFHRYWIGEHHSPAQCPNPLLLGSVLLGLTEQIRIGTGALGLFIRSPLGVAEDVRLIRTLYGDRFDLGISRGLVGSLPGDKERALLLDGRDEMLLRQEHPERLRHLCSLLSGGETAPPPLWLVGSSPETARSAAALGAGLCTSFYHASSIADLELALTLYREEFQPVSGMEEPYVILVQSGVCAASTDEAQAVLRAFFLPREGAPELTKKPMGPWLFAGDGARCREAIEAVIARFRPDEIMFHHLVHEGLETELRSLDLLAAELRLTEPQPPAVALDEATNAGIAPQMNIPSSNRTVPYLETTSGASFRDAGFFVLRTPVLPAAAFHRWSCDLSASAPGLSEKGLEAALASDRSLLRQRLEAIIDDPAIREALFIASPSLSNNVRYWRADPDSKRGQRVERSLVSYFGRMCVRSTPFGLFSGCSMGRVDGANALVLRGRADHRRVTRIDKAYLFAICEDLRRDAAVCQKLLYAPNDSLYRQGGHYRYTQAVIDRAGLTHRLVEVEHSEPLEVALSRSAGRASVGELVEALIASGPEGWITAEDAQAFINELIDAQALVSDLTPNVTGDEPGDEVIRQLRQLPHDNAVRLASLLDYAQQHLEALDAQGLGASPARYQDILPSESDLSQLLPATLLRSWPEERQFQIDLLPTAETLTISRDLAAQVLAGAELLHRICGKSHHAVLDRFRDAFAARYGDREVPLLEALDDDAGIGFARSVSPNVEASPLLDGIAFPPEEKPTNIQWGPREQYLHRRLCAAWMAGEREIALEPADIEHLSAEDVLPLPDAFSVLASVIGSPQELRSGAPRLHVKWIDGPPGARTIGRFCHIHRELREAVEGYLRDEDATRPEVLFAEVVHLPQGRSANVVCRPVLRSYEITFLGRSGASEAHQIPATDLVVGIVDGRIRLRSKKHDREVVPRLTSAHNPEAIGLGVYKFFTALQSQNSSGGTMWSWGPFEDAPFLPRVTSGRIILAPAQWRLTKNQIEPLIAQNAAEQFLAVQQMRRNLGIPRVAVVATRDEFVPVDFENSLCIETFLQLGTKADSTLIRELLPGHGELCVENPEGLLAHELVLPFVRDRRARGSETFLPSRVGGRAEERAIQRRFGPGSSWLDARFYCTTVGADRLLQQLVAPLAGLGVAEPWFFLRERDPEFHLRVRFCGAPDRLHDELLPALERLSGDLLASNGLSRFTLDTYEREVERYGGPEGIELAERLFSIDSEAALGVLARLECAHPADVRWLLALRGSSLLLDDLGLDLRSKVELTRQLTDHYFAELRGDDRLRQSLSIRFRSDRAKLAALWDPAEKQPDWLGPALPIFERRMERARPVAEEIRKRLLEGRVTASAPELARSFLYMHARRLFSTAMRAHLLVTFDLLHRLYEGRLAREKKDQKPFLT